ncbi:MULTISPECIES: hypothetical protein [unclassified Acidovorax]|uniref:hypothetical protein n=1 Tax=unclassified Acidovorax TaxID=2684926 RepID=UPI00070A413A|nr:MULTISPECIES: hypothetical protein [unclassified Acidovorax]KRC19405.1 hypothetical protein ASE28_29475 [Acidovorax sp. Root219]KRC23407.1 hypothetical protein ASE31_01985 [Acidovorax sp. Root217]
MFTRFVVHKNDDDSGRRQGLFQALADLESEGRLQGHHQDIYMELRDWFRHHLKQPSSFARAARPHAKKVALSWFKDSAVEHIRQMRRMSALLAEHDVPVDVLKTKRPGYIVYEDEHQVAAEPFSDTPT